MTFKEAFTSSIGRKVVMAITGIFLISFLVIHAGINACIWAFDNGETFNRAAHFMGSTILIRIMEVVLFIGFFIHIIQGLMWEAYNRSKRNVGYAINYGNRGSKWYSRAMGLLGTIILLFLIIHWVHFWIPSRFTGVDQVYYDAVPGPDGKMFGGRPYHNLFALMTETFSHLWVVVVYVLACISLGYHLAHGFQSAFKTMGVHNKRYQGILSNFGYGYAIVIALVFAAMPVTMYLGFPKWDPSQAVPVKETAAALLQHLSGLIG